MIGVEEEFFVVNEESLFPTSSTPKLALKLINKSARYLRASSMESPLDKELIRAGFPIIELKTTPHRDVDSLLEEVRHHRGTLADVAKEERLLIVPSGLYPTHDPKKDSRLLCCAIHVHVSGYPLKEAFCALVQNIPELVALTANSPFLGEKAYGKAMRALCSYAIGIPTGFYRRISDVIINRNLQTVELRVCDTQIISENVFGLVHLILGIIDSHCRMNKQGKKLTRTDLERRRYQAAIGGRVILKNEVNKLYEEILPSLNEFGTAKNVYEYLMDNYSPADFQVNIANSYGMAAVVESLWASFLKDKLEVSNMTKSVRRDYAMKLRDFPWLFLYFPIHLYNLYKKFMQDDMIRTVFLQGEVEKPYSSQNKSRDDFECVCKSFSANK